MCLAGCSGSSDDGSAGDTTNDSTSGDGSSDGGSGGTGDGSEGGDEGDDGGDEGDDEGGEDPDYEMYRFAIEDGALTADLHPWPEDGMVASLLAHGDFDGDGKVDVVVALRDQVQLVLDVGSSQEVVAWTVEPNEDNVEDVYVDGAAVADFDGDGDDEVALGCMVLAEVLEGGVTEQPREYVYDYDAGTGIVPVPVPTFWDGPVISSGAVVATGDVSGDEVPDLIVGSGSFWTPGGSKQTLGYLPGDGALGFGDLVALPYEPEENIVELAVVGIALADVDGDQTLDVLTSNRIGGYMGQEEPDPPVVVHAQIPGGTPQTFTTPIAGGADPMNWVFADVDGDGDLDLLAIDEGGGLMAWPGEGTGFGQAQLLVDLGDGVQSGHAFVVVTDATGDGVADLFAFTYHTAPMAFVGEGAGAFSEVLESPLDVRGELVPLALDIDGNGMHEVLWGAI